MRLVPFEVGIAGADLERLLPEHSREGTFRYLRQTFGVKQLVVAE